MNSMLDSLSDVVDFFTAVKTGSDDIISNNKFVQFSLKIFVLKWYQIGMLLKSRKLFFESTISLEQMIVAMFSGINILVHALCFLLINRELLLQLLEFSV